MPVAATHPRSLFTLLDQSHHLEVTEAITHACPQSACGATSPDETELANDTKVVYLHSLLPDTLATDWLPSIGERWGGFSADEPEELTDEGKDVTFEEFNQEEFFAAKAQRDLQPGRYESFLSSITNEGDRPGLWFHHNMLPHIPYHYLPDGRPYNGSSMPSQVDFEWVDDNELISATAQRLAIQTAMVDGLITRLLDRLDEQGLLDRALVVVTADHGVTFEPGKGSRGASPANSDRPPPLDQWVTDDLLPVPLFIKYPGQVTGAVDDRSAQTIDVLPTIVDALDLVLPPGWKFDGLSLLGKRAAHRDVQFTLDSSVKQTVTVTKQPDPQRMARYIQSILTGPSGTEHDLYRLAPYGSLVGQRAEALTTGGPTGTAEIEPAGVYDNVPADGPLAALFEAKVTGVADEAWLAVAIDGTIAGTGPVFDSGGLLRVVAMLDPSFLTPGRHTVAVYLINSSGSLRPLNTR